MKKITKWYEYTWQKVVWIEMHREKKKFNIFITCLIWQKVGRIDSHVIQWKFFLSIEIIMSIPLKGQISKFIMTFNLCLIHGFFSNFMISLFMYTNFKFNHSK